MLAGEERNLLTEFHRVVINDGDHVGINQIACAVEETSVNVELSEAVI